MTAADQELFERAVASLRTGAFDEAERELGKFLRRYPRHFGALNLFGMLLIQRSRFSEAETVMRRAIDVDDRSDATFHNYGMVLKALRRPKDALDAFNKAIAINPSVAESLYNRGTILSELSRFQDAIYHKGLAQFELAQPEEALDSSNRVLAIRPSHVEAWILRGNAHHELRQVTQALASFEQVLALKPDHVLALNNRGHILYNFGQFTDALACFERALAVQPDFALALNNRGNALRELGQAEEALASYDRALAVAPDYAEAAYNRGLLLLEFKRYDEAIVCFNQALVLKPDLKFLQGRYLYAKMLVCDWNNFDREYVRLISAVQAGRPVTPPFDIIGFPCSADDQLACARIYAEETMAKPVERLWRGGRRAHDRIRLGYVSGDFHNHATAILMAELFELHDRSHFDVLAFSFGPDDGSGMRARVVKAFDQFHDLRFMGGAEIARRIFESQVDIAIDLKGYTAGSRPVIFAHRPAPIQVNYLGYPGSMGADFFDYIVADAMTVPFEDQPFYTEMIVHLPDSYQVNDRQRAIADHMPNRLEVGLPAGAFVFCCFNNSWKINPSMFDIWMRLLRDVEGSVLWLFRDSDSEESNLRREARARAIDPARLIFADRQELPYHLARHRLADLFLDTLPYNAHTTASDALWAGLPVLTCRGETFAGRVAASLLNAVGLPELVTGNLADYEALALKLARSPALLAEIRAKLARNRDTCPLFDTKRFTRHIEAAYTTMWETWQRGEAPKSFAVEPIRS